MIDRLMAQLGTQNQYQPSTGFPQGPMDAQAAMPAQQNTHIAVGDYQMPRIGGGFAQDTLPQNAAPTSYAAPQAQPMQQPPSFLQPQASPGGFGGVMRGALANMQAGPLGMIGGAIAGGMGMGQGTEQDQAYRMLNQKYQALVPILGEQKARLAVLSPDAEKTLLGDVLGKNYNFTTLPDGTIVRQDPRTGEVQPVYSGGAKPTFGVVSEEDGRKVYGWIDPNKRSVSPVQPMGTSGDRGTVNGPDGKPIPIPPGVDRKTFVNEISRANAKAAAGEKTEVQAKSEKFANKMELAEKNVSGLDSQYTDTIGAGGFFRGTEYVPGGNSLQSSSYQKYKQARDNFITALLRDESGAAIGTAEFNRYEKELFPQPGDGPEVVAQKREARRVAIEGMKKSAGPGYKSPTSANEGGGKADPLGLR
ncbi:hypothetical protein [Bradyrhizobium ottawaense]|uniref:hypothetical protein n=1 Tax=Bradyrhizobium ottawaense TaxID=931866 RepID=UPI003516941F